MKRKSNLKHKSTKWNKKLFAKMKLSYNLVLEMDHIELLNDLLRKE